jgi:hypothetical protein
MPIIEIELRSLQLEGTKYTYILYNCNDFHLVSMYPLYHLHCRSLVESIVLDLRDLYVDSATKEVEAAVDDLVGDFSIIK